MKRILIIVFMIGLLGGCSTHLADFTMISNQSINVKKVNLDNVPQKHNVIGKSSKVIFLFVPLGIPTLHEAVDDALQKGNGDLMTDVSVYQKGWWFLIGKMGLEVKGTVLNSKGADK